MVNTLSRKRYSEEFTRINRRYEEKYFPKVQKAIKAKQSSLIDIVKQQGIQAGIKHVTEDLPNNELSAVVKQLYKEVGLRHARKTHRYIKEMVSRKGLYSYSWAVKEVKGFGFNDTWIAYILNYLNQFLFSKITFTVNETTKEKLLEVLHQAVTEGWGVDRTVQELADLNFIPYQAARIVRTEINRAANVGTMAGADTSEFEMNKMWISAHDSRVRGTRSSDHADHRDIDGLVVGFDEKFRDIRSGDLLSYPGDPNASAATTINCRCSVAPIAKRDDKGRLIRRANAGMVLGLMRPPIAASPGQFFRR